MARLRHMQQVRLRMHLAALAAQLPEGLERGGQGRLHVHLGTPAIGNGKQVPVQHRAPCVEGGRQAIAHGRLAGQGAGLGQLLFQGHQGVVGLDGLGREPELGTEGGGPAVIGEGRRVGQQAFELGQAAAEAGQVGAEGAGGHR